MSLAAAELNQQMLPVFLGLLLAAAIAWLFLSARLYTLLRRNFAHIYETLGRPAPFLQRKGRGNMRVFRFLFRRDYEATRDPALIRLCQGLRYVFFIYAVSLGGCLLLLLDKMLHG